MRSSWWSEPPHQTNTPCAEKEGLTKTPNKHYSSWNKSSSNHLADCISYVCILVSFEINTPVCVFVKKSYFTIYKEICFFFFNPQNTQWHFLGAKYTQKHKSSNYQTYDKKKCARVKMPSCWKLDGTYPMSVPLELRMRPNSTRRQIKMSNSSRTM